MFSNYFKTAWRNLAKSKVFSVINILGLTIGITTCMMIFLYIMNEFSVDNFHEKKENIYRVMRGSKNSGIKAPYLSGPYATHLLNDFQGEIESAVRVISANGLVTFGDRAFNEKKLYITDPVFFTLFSFPLIKGDPATVLREPYSIVLSESTAKKYFGEADPVNKVVQMDKSFSLKVTGVFKDIPSNSHMNCDLVMPLTMYYDAEWFDVWMNNNNFTYILLAPGVKENELEKKFPAFMDRHMGAEMERMSTRFDLSLTPLKDIYFEEQSPFDNVKHGDKKVVYIFLSVALFILIIACINFINLSTIRAVDRSKEVGLRKVMGARRKQLIFQFIGESVLITIISCIFSVALLNLLMPWYMELLGYNLSVSWNSWEIWSFLLAVVIVAGVLAGSYPAFILAAFAPVQALRGKVVPGKAGAIFRQALVVFQFSISVLLIIGTIIIMNQMKYMKSKDLGYTEDQTMVIRLDNTDISNHRIAFKRELQNVPGIASVSLMSGEPGGFFDAFTFEVEGELEPWKARTEFSDFEFVETLGLKIIAGRDFSPEYGTDSAQAVLLNRTAVTQLGLSPDEAIGKWIRNTLRDSTRRRVVGVVEDFHFLSLKEKIDALVISSSEDRRVALVRLEGGNIHEGVKKVNEVYRKIAPGYPFEYTFMDQKFDEMYKADIQQQRILSIFSALAIIIACLGLFGLASFTAARRNREISIRKVLGSSVNSIVVLLSKDLLKPVIIATIIAVPVAYLLMKNWLDNFAYRTALQWWIFIIAAVLTLTIALITVCVKAIRAARTKPVTYLKTE